MLESFLLALNFKPKLFTALGVLCQLDISKSHLGRDNQLKNALARLSYVYTYITFS